MPEMGKVLVVIGVVIAIVGVLMWGGIGRGWLGRLPGDINYSRDNFSFHIPLVTCLLLSILLIVIMWLLRKF
jgi:hypothetical protein